MGLHIQPYKSKSGKSSGVTGFSIGYDYIQVQFNLSDIYTYSYQTAGEQAVEKMKALAKAQKGLSTYISRNQPGHSQN